MPDSSSTVRFWLLNALVWALYGVAGIGLRQAYFSDAGSAGVLITLGLALALFGCSGAIRALALRADWWARGTAGLLLRLALSVALGAAVAQLLVNIALHSALAWNWVSLGRQTADFSPKALLLYWYTTAVMLALWAALWAGLHSLRRIRSAELARLRAEAERSALERDALRARLNPHFMFNALNNLRALILEDPERARDMVTHLSRTLRQALAHNRSEQVTLAEELAVVDDYLAIEAVHFEQRLQVNRQIDADALQAQLPAMALQLLVENAIKHGIASRPGGGEVQIRATLDNDVLRLQVDNPLGGASEPAHGHGVGLAYLRAQLGTQGSFMLQPVGDRMQALLEIPQ
ncbi:sensor histidine kinase [Stenotrophomonas maltophilia]|uniref:sensor histidine kinase n=1 Tax=Stenotrophomonas maltophilia TaxID=40324 RepID=UPI00066DA0AC|nr:histidine kinase [Stenotrophomonas maltophilia]ASE55359.1 sensor histidine kinase [Stenotrophomonas maltophilia]MDH2062111.1 histidine kinase [Stenotrophomonas maltophilia]UXB20791.1 histidine kinase [Stenotrophomonas maltophilia]HDX0898964.1 histidine kinase [Stenotrophomonas maltophilia]HDX0917262.1 histidine kinase [Stenotrophomonas maltophilia]